MLPRTFVFAHCLHFRVGFTVALEQAGKTIYVVGGGCKTDHSSCRNVSFFCEGSIHKHAVGTTWFAFGSAYDCIQ